MAHSWVTEDEIPGLNKKSRSKIGAKTKNLKQQKGQFSQCIITEKQFKSNSITYRGETKKMTHNLWTTWATEKKATEKMRGSGGP